MEITPTIGNRRSQKIQTSNVVNADQTIFGIEHGKAQTEHTMTCNMSAATASASGGSKARTIRRKPMADYIYQKIAWLLPKKLVYWCAIRLLSHATVGKYNNQVVPDLKAMDALERWRKD
jgi:hypothetical protein